MEEHYKAVAAYLESAIGIVKHMGLKVISMKERHVKLLMPLQKNVNHVGSMYAGSLFTLGEIMGGAIFVASFDIGKYYPLVKEVQIRYRKPALTDITVEATLTEDRIEQILKAIEEKGKADFNLDLELLDAKGEVVSLMHGIWQGRENK
ncbi:MAG: YiiD C-terminal domain-containing protein [Deltaproteobacteria bacterium]|nr:YiiD C-terminal domain-containing protein [Deltaproteobacteria bacterium]